MNRETKIELVQRSFGLKHKLKVHSSMKPPETHEELAQAMLAQWELEDELTAIEEILQDARRVNSVEKRAQLEKSFGTKKKKS
jgi:hypothetical protein